MAASKTKGMTTQNLAGDDKPAHPRELGAKTDAEPTRHESEIAATIRNAPVEHAGESDDPAALTGRPDHPEVEYDPDLYDYHEINVGVGEDGFGSEILEGVSVNAIHHPHLVDGGARVEISAANGDVDTRFAVTGSADSSATVRYYIPKK